MSGFFSIDGRSDQQQQTESSTNLFLSSSSRNVEIYNKGIELWQQYYQFHQQRFQQQNTQDLNFCSNDSRRRPNSDNVNIVDGDIGDEHSDYNYYRSAGIKAMMDQGGSSFEGFNCQDCGNRAKKDCTHMRCRTCCKSRGFQCQTHVRSTWVPAAKRRERHQLGSSDLQHTQQQQQQLAVGDENRKQIAGGSGGGGGGFELGQFPPEVHSSADFTLVRVSSIDGAEEHLAYQTAVNIGGHTFKGILYDRGPHGRGGASLQQAPDSTAATSAPAAATSGLTNPAIMDPSIYPAQLSGFMAGTQFFLPPRP